MAKSNKAKKNGLSFITITLAVIIALVTLLFVTGLYYQLKDMYKHYESRHWESVQAKIIGAEIIKIFRANGKSSPQPQYASVSYQIKLNYTYTVNGKSYEGNDRCSPVAGLCLGYSTHEAGSAVAIKNKILGSNIEVFFNPNNPKDSVVYMASPTAFPAVMVLIIFCACVMILVITGRKIK